MVLALLAQLAKEVIIKIKYKCLNTQTTPGLLPRKDSKGAQIPWFQALLPNIHIWEDQATSKAPVSKVLKANYCTRHHVLG